MNDHYLTRYYFYYKFFDLISSIVIIGFLAAIAISSYDQAVKLAESINVSGSCFTKARMDCMYYRAIHGEWPENNQQASDFGWNDDYNEQYSSNINKAIIEKGAIHLKFGNRTKMQGKIITMRPAVPAENQMGPVQWICGDIDQTKGWITYGSDKTNIQKQFIHRDLRRD